MFEIPLTLLCKPGKIKFFENSFLIAFDNISVTRVDFPLPDTPVIEISFPSGKETV
jgi:hypothetical protein